MHHHGAPPQGIDPPGAQLFTCLMPYLSALIAAGAGWVVTTLLLGSVPPTDETKLAGAGIALFGTLFLRWPPLFAAVFGAGVGVIGATIGRPDAGLASAAIAGPIVWLLSRRF